MRNGIAGLVGVIVLTTLVGRAGAENATTRPEAGNTATTKPHVNRAATPRKQPEEAWAQKHASFVERAKKGDVEVLFTGDSITAGWNGAGSAVWQKYFGEMKAANFGIGGERTQHILYRLGDGELEGINPKVFVLLIGTNNASAGDPPEDTAQAIRAILDLVKAQCPTTKVLLLAILPRGDANDPKRLVNQKVNELIAKFDDGGKTIRFLDIGGKLVQTDGAIDKTIMADGVHLTRKGFEIEAETILPVISEMLGAK
jgi:beta-glucosidase